MKERTWDQFMRLLAVETDDCVLWPRAVSHRGYGVLAFGDRHGGTSTFVTHRLALILTEGNPPAPHLEAAHGPCNNRRCMNPRHLSWKTRSENAKDMLRDGTHYQPHDHRWSLQRAS